MALRLIYSVFVNMLALVCTLLADLNPWWALVFVGFNALGYLAASFRFAGK